MIQTWIESNSKCSAHFRDAPQIVRRRNFRGARIAPHTLAKMKICQSASKVDPKVKIARRNTLRPREAGRNVARGRALRCITGSRINILSEPRPQWLWGTAQSDDHNQRVWAPHDCVSVRLLQIGTARECRPRPMRVLDLNLRAHRSGRRCPTSQSLLASPLFGR